jgi:CRP-like cAMP-binding protein
METSRGTGGGVDFRRLPDIERLPPPYQVQLLSQARVQRCTDGQVLFNIGDTDDAALYLIDGMVLMVGNDASVVEVRSNSPEARKAMDPSQPRRYSARAVGYATVLQVKRSLLEKLTSLADIQSAPVPSLPETTHDDPGNWMTRIARAPIFARLPPSNLLQLFERGNIVEVGAGEIVMTEGNYPSHLHVVQDGEFVITRTVPEGGESVPVAELRPGDSFGAEALLTERNIDVNVKAVTAGRLVRIGREDFLHLIVEPLIQAIPLRQAGELVRSGGARWLDVRPASLAADIKGEQALHIPLNELRIRLDSLPRQVPYIVTSDNTACSRAGVFILLDAGLDARYLTEVAAVSTAGEVALPTPLSGDDNTEPARSIMQPVMEVSVKDSSQAIQMPAETPHPASMETAVNPLGDISSRIHHEIDLQMAALKQRVEQELSGRQQLIDRMVQEEVRRKSVEIETRYQLMVTRKEQLLRRSYERVLAMASNLKQQMEELQAAQNGFAHMLDGGLSMSEADTTIVDNNPS